MPDTKFALGKSLVGLGLVLLVLYLLWAIFGGLL